MERYVDKLDETDCFGDRISHLLNDENNTIVKYCQKLINLQFYGETSNCGRSKVTDKCNTHEKYHLGLFLRLLHLYITSFNDVKHLTGNEAVYLLLLKFIAIKRKRDNESRAHAYYRLMKDNERFIQIYKKLPEHPKGTTAKSYWGTRQQLRAGKVIADFIDPQYKSLDPIFGTLLCPCAGRCGPGDSHVIHNLLFDQSGPVAYHSAVHDGFGYLRNKHMIGPGYSYLEVSVLSTTNPWAGQIFGLLFWRTVLTSNSSS